MALDLSTAQAVHPRAVPISAISPSAPFATRLGIPFAKPFAPRSAPASALAPLTGAGVTLTRYVLLKAYLEMANASRDFWSKMAQMILLNLLLPVLTALLGYVFASKSSGK